MIEIYVPVVVRQRDALSKEFSRGRPPYSSRFDTKRHKLDPTSRLDSVKLEIQKVQIEP